MHRKQKKLSKFQFFLVTFLLVLFAATVGVSLFFLQKNVTPTSVLSTWELTESFKLKLPSNLPKTEDLNQEIQPESELAKSIEKKITNNRFIGTALVIQKGEVLLQKGYGYADIAHKRLNTYKSIFQIGSIQKAMTAVLVLQQVQAGRLSLDETLDHFYPNIPESNKITIRQLLAMCSGLYQDGKPTKNMTEEEFLLFSIARAKMGIYGKYKYEAINYKILAGILEKLTNISYRDLFTQNFIQHLQLSRTFFYNDFLKAPDRTYAYKEAEEQSSETQIADNPLSFGQEVGTGNVGMTASDLYQFTTSLLSGKLLKLAILNNALSKSTYRKYRGGLYNFPNYIKGHGVEEGFEANLMLTKDGQTSVILLSNQYQRKRPHTKLATDLFETINQQK